MTPYVLLTVARVAPDGSVTARSWVVPEGLADELERVIGEPIGEALVDAEGIVAAGLAGRPVVLGFDT